MPHESPEWVKEFLMKNVMALFIAVALSVPAIAQTITANITGYDEGKWRVIGTSMERQIIANAVKPLQTKLSSQPNSKISITVYGYTDALGVVGSNDTLGKVRAAEVKDYLTARFPDANIVALTAGDTANARMVRIEAKIVPVAAPPKVTSSWWQQMSPGTIAVFIALIVLLASPFVLVGRRRKPQLELVTQPQLEPSKQQVIEEVPVSPVAKEIWLEFSRQECDYEVLVEKVGRNFIVPFSRPGKGKMSFLSEREAVRSLRGCVVQTEFADQLKQLIMARKARITRSKG